MTAPTIVITRPEADSGSFASQLHMLGCKTLLAPVLTIQPRRAAKNDFAVAFKTPVRAIIVTSKHAVAGLAPYVPRLDIPVIAVGAVTAAAACAQGFTHVYTANGTVHDVVEYVKKTILPGEGAILHAAGEHLTADVSALLGQAGIPTQKIITYRARAAAMLPVETLKNLLDQRIWGVTFFSKRSAQVFVKLVAEADAKPALKHVNAFAFSPAIANAVDANDWRAVHASQHSSQKALISLITELLPDP